MFVNKYRIYCLKNKEGKIVYIGMTTYVLEERLGGHIKKYKHRKNYSIELIRETTCKDEAKKLETYYIDLYDTVNNGENITYGMGRKNLGANKTSFKKNNGFGKICKYKILCIETGDVGSAKELAEKLNLNRHRIYDVCNGRRKSHKNLTFKII